MENSREHKRSIFAWTSYDWANSAFVTTISATVLPVYFSNVAAAQLPDYQRTAIWSWTTAIYMILVALMGPVFGAMADFSGTKKVFFTFAAFGILGAGLLYLVKEGQWIQAVLFYIIGGIGFSGANVFYDSLLPHVATDSEQDMVSSRGYAMGYAGGGILLAINLVMIMTAKTPEQTALMSRLSFLMVAVWWAVFSIPLLLWVKEPPRRVQSNEVDRKPIQVAFSRLGHTFREIKHFKELFKFILAFWLYNNGIGTIIFMASIYGKELKFSDTTVIGTLLMVQFVAIPFAILFGWLGKKMGTKRAIMLSIMVYAVIAIFGYFMTKEWHFWFLGFLVATVQGGSQALSRSLFGRMVPRSKSAEFFSFFSVSEKVAGTVGPLLFGLVSTVMKGSRLSIVSLIIFFIAGVYLLSKVNEGEGIKLAEMEENEILQASLPN